MQAHCTCIHTCKNTMYSVFIICMHVYTCMLFTMWYSIGQATLAHGDYGYMCMTSHSCMVTSYKRMTSHSCYSDEPPLHADHKTTNHAGAIIIMYDKPCTPASMCMTSHSC